MQSKDDRDIEAGPYLDDESIVVLYGYYQSNIGLALIFSHLWG